MASFQPPRYLTAACTPARVTSVTALRGDGTGSLGVVACAFEDVTITGDIAGFYVIPAEAQDGGSFGAVMDPNTFIPLASDTLRQCAPSFDGYVDTMSWLSDEVAVDPASGALSGSLLAASRDNCVLLSVSLDATSAQGCEVGAAVCRPPTWGASSSSSGTAHVCTFAHHRRSAGVSVGFSNGAVGVLEPSHDVWVVAAQPIVGAPEGMPITASTTTDSSSVYLYAIGNAIALVDTRAPPLRAQACWRWRRTITALEGGLGEGSHVPVVSAGTADGHVILFDTRRSDPIPVSFVQLTEASSAVVGIARIDQSGDAAFAAAFTSSGTGHLVSSSSRLGAIEASGVFWPAEQPDGIVPALRGCRAVSAVPSSTSGATGGLLTVADGSGVIDHFTFGDAAILAEKASRDVPWTDY